MPPKGAEIYPAKGRCQRFSGGFGGPAAARHREVTKRGPGHSGPAPKVGPIAHVLPGAEQGAVAKVDRAHQAAVNSRPRST